MSKTIFISDFDKTISEKDFYHIVIDDYIGEEGKQYYKEWKKDNKIDTNFLNKIFSWYSFSKKEHDEILDKVKIDETFKEFYDYVIGEGMDFAVVSAGFDYYINYALKQQGLEQIDVYTNKGEFDNNTFALIPDEGMKYYSSVYGIDKAQVISDLASGYDKVYFAGDSEPDFRGAILADVVFAKGELVGLLKEHNKPFYEFDKFSEILNYLKQGV